MKYTWHKPERPGASRGMLIEAERRGRHPGYLVVSNAITLAEAQAQYGERNITVMPEVPVVIASGFELGA